MNCTRCKIKLIAGKNIPRDWHLPICTKCRERLFNKQDFDLTYEENKIMRERLRRDRNND